MESLKDLRDNRLANIIRVSNNISSVSRDTIESRLTTKEGTIEIKRYIKELQTILKDLTI